MKLIPLTQGLSAMVDDEDFEYLNQFKWCASRRPNTFYAERRDNKNLVTKIIYMHRDIMNPEGKTPVDHIDGDGLNNQRSNLRMADKSKNMANRGLQKNNTSGYKGVSWDKNNRKWQASIDVENNKVFLGRFRDVLDAARAYDEAAIKYFGEFAKLNLHK